MSYILYDYFRSTASYRVRIALHHKQVNFTTKEVHLINQGGEQHLPEYSKRNPQQLVPLLEESKSGLVLNQSLAIIDYLETTHPENSLYPIAAPQKYLAKSLALQIACDIHPLNNLRVLNYLTNELAVDETNKRKWYHHWLKLGFDALEQQLVQTAENSNYCIANQLTIADICLIPQIYNANRFEFDMSAYPQLNKINQHCLSLPAFQKAAPKG